MTVKIYGVGQSTCTRRIATIFKEKQVPYEIVPVDFAAGENRTAAYLEKQPFGQVPYIVDEDGFELFESRAIGRYIATKYANQGTPLIPTDPKAIAKFEQAASIESFDFEPSAYGIALEVLFKKFLRQEKDHQEKRGRLHRPI